MYTFTQEDIQEAVQRTIALTAIQDADGTREMPVSIHTSFFNGAPMQATIEPVEWVVGQGRGLLIDGEWKLLTADELGEFTEDVFHSGPLHCSIPTDDPDTEWITVKLLVEAALKAANKKILSCAPPCDKCEWWIKSLIIDADPKFSSYTVEINGKQERMYFM